MRERRTSEKAAIPGGRGVPEVSATSCTNNGLTCSARQTSCGEARNANKKAREIGYREACWASFGGRGYTQGGALRDKNAAFLSFTLCPSHRSSLRRQKTLKGAKRLGGETGTNDLPTGQCRNIFAETQEGTVTDALSSVATGNRGDRKGTRRDP